MGHMCPSFLLDGPNRFKQHPGPCLVSKGNDTHSPPVLVKEWSCDERFAVADERNRMQGFAIGITHGFFDIQGKPRVDVSEDFRIRLDGSSFNYDHLFVVLSAWAVYATSPVVSAFPVTEIEIQGAGEKLELYLSGLTHKDKVAFAAARIQRNNGLKKLFLRLLPDHNLPHQTQRKIPVAAALQASADATMDSMLAEGSHIEVNWSEDVWIHAMVWLKKTPVRIDEKTGVIALRPIGVYYLINSALEYPAYWCDESPNMTTMTTEIASDAKFMIISDAKDGYHAIFVLPAFLQLPLIFSAC